MFRDSEGKFSSERKEKKNWVERHLQNREVMPRCQDSPTLKALSRNTGSIQSHVFPSFPEVGCGVCRVQMLINDCSVAAKPKGQTAALPFNSNHTGRRQSLCYQMENNMYLSKESCSLGPHVSNTAIYRSL